MKSKKTRNCKRREKKFSWDTESDADAENQEPDVDSEGGQEVPPELPNRPEEETLSNENDEDENPNKELDALRSFRRNRCE